MSAPWLPLPPSLSRLWLLGWFSFLTSLMMPFCLLESLHCFSFPIWPSPTLKHCHWFKNLNELHPPCLVQTASRVLSFLFLLVGSSLSLALCLERSFLTSMKLFISLQNKSQRCVLRSVLVSPWWSSVNGILINFTSECGSPLNSVQIDPTYPTHLSQQLDLGKTALNQIF